MTIRALGAAALSLVVACTTAPPATDDAARPDAAIDSSPEPDAPEAPPDARPQRDGGPSQLSVFESGTRLKMRVGTTPDGAKTFFGWRDTLRNEDCAFANAADGMVRCLPSTVATYSVDLFWADAGCTTTRLVAAPAGCPMLAGYARSVTTCPPNRFVVYVLGARHQGTAYVKSGATCTAFTGTQDYYLLGAEVAADSFVAATESLE